MWKCSFAEEPVDLKLLCLRMMKKTGIILTAMIVGALVLGGIFYLKETVFSPDESYQVVGETYIDYIPEEAYGISRVYITDEVWKSLVKSDDFVESIENELSGQGYDLSRERIISSIQAAVISDSRIVTTTVKTNDPQLAVAISEALQNAILDFCKDRQEIAESFVMTAPEAAQRKVWAEGTATAILMGAVLGLVLSVVIFLFSYVMDDSVYLPSTFEKRYGLPMFGTLKSQELSANIGQFCKGCGKVVVAGVAAGSAVEDVAKALGEKIAQPATERKAVQQIQFVSGGIVELNAPWISQVKEADGVVLAIASGRRDGRQIERIIDFLQKQEVDIKGAVLCDADQKLLARYYRPGILAKGKKVCEKKQAEEKV